MEGVFTIILRVVGGELSSALAEAVTRLTRTLRQSLVFWRVLDSFRRRHDSEMSRLRRLAQDHPIIADVLTAYDARIEQFHIVEKEVVERKRRCAHDECPSPESDNTNERMRACACRSVWYCSVDCQRQHWTSEHHEKCVSGHKKRGQTASRDIHFIVELVLDYWKKNERRILDDALAIDPLRTHQLEVYIDLRPAVIDHTIRLMGQRPCEDTAWATELFAVWLDHGYTNVSCGVFEMPGEHEEAVQDEIEDEAS
ncbi:uncharacterized protein SCHCODRAFT_02481691 [Schizophyllum commune H4-8]|uniref:Expressed protein n=1 Tax=Schizophyllum commune (strain H4-8 / FGSC 9210) TaxID=578458 RepID=D8PVC9_SCHCM|nr:uncharacterized protein SCHCODRAFT_02481691 [Schizophyllum commune H4-8]KAI5900405.1 hypothetical protein SCHCODRAFT_02481691 [Schizophyllum commune H4-8]